MAWAIITLGLGCKNNILKHSCWHIDESSIVLFSFYCIFKWAQYSRAEYWYQIDELIFLLLRKVYNFSFPNHDSHFSHHQSLAYYRHLINIFWMNENLPYNWQLHCFMTLRLQIAMPKSSMSSYLSKKIILETCLELHLKLAPTCLCSLPIVFSSRSLAFSLILSGFQSQITIISDSYPSLLPTPVHFWFSWLFTALWQRDASGCTLSGWHRVSLSPVSQKRQEEPQIL